MPDQNRKFGVYYPKDASLGFWSRAAIGLIDACTVCLAWIILGVIPGNLVLGKIGTAYAVVSLLPISFVYFVLFKRSDFRTAGYRMFGVRVVNLEGKRPSVFQMVNRLTLMLLGPLNGIIDLLWITSDDARQALRDKWSGTYVIRSDAEPAGTGPIVTTRYEILVLNLVFEEVSRNG